MTAGVLFIILHRMPRTCIHSGFRRFFELGAFVALVVFLESLNPGFFERSRGSFRSIFLDNGKMSIPENAHIGPF